MLQNNVYKLFLDECAQTYNLGETLSDAQAVHLCLQQGFLGYGLTSPNPPVGCVILDSKNRLIGCGYHSKAGTAHAEIRALEDYLSYRIAEISGHNPKERRRCEIQLRIKNNAWDLSSEFFNSISSQFKISASRVLTREDFLQGLEGAKFFVTLEPCAHAGRTPSCAKTLAGLPIAKVIALLKDPNPIVDGSGFSILKEAGKNIECREENLQGSEVQAARALCEFFLWNQKNKTPFVSMKVASSLDGFMGLKNKESQWITSDASRLFARYLRGAHDACLVGKNTILFDDPKLDRRDTVFADQSRKLVILDSKAEILKLRKSQIFKSFLPSQMIFIVDETVDQTAILKTFSDTHILQIQSRYRNDQMAFWRELLNQLKQQSIQSLWVEGGAEVFSGLLNSNFVNRLWCFQAPVLLGAVSGESWTKDLRVNNMNEKRQLMYPRSMSLGSDVLRTGLF